MMHIVADTTLSRRIDRVVNDVCALLHDNTDGAVERATRWVGHVLQDAMQRRPGGWWFLKKRMPASLAIGADIVELRGDIDKIKAVYAPRRLRKISLDEITELRAAAVADKTPNGGTPAAYAVESGNKVRVHLWPAPSAATAFQVLFTRPIDLAIVPDFWETMILNGVIGQFGRHFDRDQLSQDPEEFERRYERQLKHAAIETHDIETARAWNDLAVGETTVTAASATDAATALVVPASLTGIGYVTIETGDYPLVVA